jgi:hypothetical protein
MFSFNCKNGLTLTYFTGLNQCAQISWLETVVPGYFALGFIATAVFTLCILIRIRVNFFF